MTRSNLSLPGMSEVARIVSSSFSFSLLLLLLLLLLLFFRLLCIFFFYCFILVHPLIALHIIEFFSPFCRETLNAQEKVIFESACRWAEAECGRQELESSPENLRRVLREALLLLRIPAMSLEGIVVARHKFPWTNLEMRCTLLSFTQFHTLLTEFANGAAQSGILTLEETNEIFLYYTAQKKPSLSFPVVKRQGLLPLCCHRFQSSAYRSNQWRYRWICCCSCCCLQI